MTSRVLWLKMGITSHFRETVLQLNKVFSSGFKVLDEKGLIRLGKLVFRRDLEKSDCKVLLKVYFEFSQGCLITQN